MSGIIEQEAGPSLQHAQLDLLHRIRQSTNRMDHLITDSLSYTRVLREDLPLVPVNLGTLLRGILDTYPDFHPPQADIVIEFADLVVFSNQAALTQVFSHLLGNAVKFVAPGIHPRVRVWAETADVERRSVGASERPASESEYAPRSTLHAPTVRVFIQDNGIGIPKESQERIFGIFQRLHGQSEYPGTGIGLAIVKKAAQRLGGRLGLESEPGKGTTFWLELPTAAQSQNQLPLQQAA